MEQGYCPKCGRIVKASKEDLDAGLAIFLLLCTGGIGFVIYLILYLMEPKNKCPFCNSKLQPIDYKTANVPAGQLNLPPSGIGSGYGNAGAGTAAYAEAPDASVYDDAAYAEADTTPVRYCPFCGAELRAGDQRFCSYCGSPLEL